ncbi:MAG: folate-binding protein [Deltaproteobacteria bacterium]
MLVERLAAARGGAAVGPVEERGILRLAGKGARDFLHRMSTQHLSALPADGSAYAAFLEPKGHILGEGLVVARPDDLLLLTEPGEVPVLLPHLRKYLLAAPVKIDDVSGEICAMAVLGPLGVEQATGVEGATVAATPRRGVKGVEVIGPSGVLSALRERLLAGGASDLSAADLEVLRIEEGVARFGVDMDGARLPMEAGLTRDAIHFQKGCYPGQEVVARATFRGHIQRGLVQLELPAGAGPGTPLSSGGVEVGQVASAADTTQGRLGLGYLRRALWREGERLTTPAGDAIVRRVLVSEPG